MYNYKPCSTTQLFLLIPPLTQFLCVGKSFCRCFSYHPIRFVYVMGFEFVPLCVLCALCGSKVLPFRSPDPAHSVLSAFIGEIDAARLAGIMAAKNAEMASATAATVSANGSQLEMP